MAVQFPAEVQSVRFRQRWHGVSRDGEGEHTDHSAVLSQNKIIIPLFMRRAKRSAF